LSISLISDDEIPMCLLAKLVRVYEDILIDLVGCKTMHEGKCFLYFYKHDIVHIEQIILKNLNLYVENLIGHFSRVANVCNIEFA